MRLGWVVASAAAVEREEAVVVAAGPTHEGDDAGCRHMWMKLMTPDVG